MYIIQGTSNEAELGSLIIKIYVTDNFSFGPETSEYQFELKVVEPGEETYIDEPSEPPPEQVITESAGLFSTAD